MEMVSKKVVCVALLCMIVVSIAPDAEALTCGQVTSALLPCLNYLNGNAALPANCCGGVKSLASQAQTTPDRQTACKCLKEAAASFKSIDLGKAAGLPGKCGVSIPYKIDPNTDCSKVN